MKKASKQNNNKKIPSKSSGTYYPSRFATTLRDFLEMKEFNQNKLSEKLGVTRQTISLYANGNSLPDIKTLKKIVAYFKENGYDYSCDYWLGLIDDPTTNVEVKEINKKYGLSEKALETLEFLNNQKNNFNKSLESIHEKPYTYIETINNLIEEMHPLTHETALISLIDTYINAPILNENQAFGIESNGNTKVVDTSKTKYTNSWLMIDNEVVLSGILAYIQNNLSEKRNEKLKEGENK